MNQNNENRTKKRSNTLEESDVLPVIPEDQVQSNGIGNVAQKARNAESAPE